MHIAFSCGIDIDYDKKHQDSIAEVSKFHSGWSGLTPRDNEVVGNTIGLG